MELCFQTSNKSPHHQSTATSQSKFVRYGSYGSYGELKVVGNRGLVLDLQGRG